MGANHSHGHHGGHPGGGTGDAWARATHVVQGPPKPWTIVYDPACLKDCKALDRGTVESLRALIDAKLTTHPQEYGEPYVSSLKGLWKLKTGKLRIAYLIDHEHHTIHIVAMGWRHSIGSNESVPWLHARYERIHDAIGAMRPPAGTAGRGALSGVAHGHGTGHGTGLVQAAYLGHGGHAHGAHNAQGAHVSHVGHARHR